MTKEQKIYCIIGRLATKIGKASVLLILFLPLIMFLLKTNKNLFIYLFGFVIGTFICFFAGKTFPCIVNRVKKKKVINSKQ